MKQKLIESTINPAFVRPLMSDSVSNDGKTWSVPIWTFGVKNLNGRIYPQELGERLVKDKRSSLCMDGHEELTEYAGAMAYAHDPYIENGQLWVKFEFIDEAYEKKIRFCLENEIPVGVSSVGWGETDKDGNVNPDTYEIVRYFDFVTSPANETYVTESEDESQNETQGEAAAENITEATATVDAATAENNRRRLRLLQKYYSR